MKKLQAVAVSIWRETYRHDTLLEWSEIKPGTLHHCRTMTAARAAMAATLGVANDVVWLPIPGFPRYEANSKGSIRRAALPDGTPIFHALKPHQDRKTGHLKVSVYRDGKQHRRGVHQLVALAFHGEPPPGKPIACHKNGDAGDCQPGNLRWGSHQDNVDDMMRHRRIRIGGENQWKVTKVERRPE
jgi:hypothetical protein